MTRRFVLVLVGVLAACGSGGTSPTLTAPSATSPPSATPTPVGTTPEMFTGTVSGSSPMFPSCSIVSRNAALHLAKPCAAVEIVPDLNGTLEATLTWSNGNADLDLYLVRGTNQLAASNGVGPREEIRLGAIQGGATYRLVVSYFDGSTTETFTLRAVVVAATG